MLINITFQTYSMRELDSKLYELEDKYIKKLK